MDLDLACERTQMRPRRKLDDCAQCGAASGHWPNCPNYPGVAAR